MPQPKRKKAPASDGLEAAAAQVLDRVGERGEVEPPAAAGELVVDPRHDGDVFRVMDAYDEAQILDELEGRPSDKMVYSFGSGGDRKTGLSYAGVSESVRTLNSRGLTKIRVAKDVIPQFRELQETDEKGETVTYVEALVYGEDVQNGGGEWGLARQPKFQTYRNSDRKPTLDKFATTKALSKAQRNAQLELIPLAFREILIALALKDGRRVQELRAGIPNVKQDQLPAPIKDEKADRLREEIRLAYDVVKGLTGGVRAMPPGRFNTKLRRAESIDHASLEEFRDELQSLAEHLEAEAAKEKAA
jgi:hypothetical protein